MREITLLAVIAAVAPSPVRAEPPQQTAVTTEEKLTKLAAPCSLQTFVNLPNNPTEDDLLAYRPNDMYVTCADEMDALVKTREPVDDRLLQMAENGATLPERYRSAWVLIHRRNEKVVPILEKMTKSSVVEERFLAWSAYTHSIRDGCLKPPGSFDVAINHYQNEKNRHVRSLGAYFLGACKAKEAIPLLTAAMKDDLDLSAVEALGEIGDPQPVPALIERAKKETWNRHTYYRALGQIGSPEAVDYLIECLDDNFFAVEALFETRSPKALPAIEKHLERLQAQKEPNESDLATAQVCVLRLKHADPREHLFALAEDQKQSGKMRTEALDALRHYDRKPFADRLLKLYRAERDDWMRMFLIRLLRDLPGEDITEAMIDQALADGKDVYRFSHVDLVAALNQRLGTSFRRIGPMVDHLRRVREPKDR